MVVSEPRTPVGFDDESARWVDELSGEGPRRDAATIRLHEMLLHVARGELRRRSGSVRISGPELDDLAYQATADAVMAITAKVATFRGESRFTTWAYRFVILEVSSKLGRHFWRHPGVHLEIEQWAQLPDRLGFDPAHESQWRALAAAIRHAVDEELTDHQRRVFVSIVLREIPLDALVIELGSNRNAIYKTMFDARRKVRAFLATNGYLTDDSSRPHVTDWTTLDRFLRADPNDVGCDEALRVLHMYVELGADAAARFPGVAAHLRACGPCGTDFDGLLAAISA